MASLKDSGSTPTIPVSSTKSDTTGYVTSSPNTINSPDDSQTIEQSNSSHTAKSSNSPEQQSQHSSSDPAELASSAAGQETTAQQTVDKGQAQAPSVDTELQQFMDGKGLSFVGEHIKHEPVQKLLKMYRESDQYALKLRSEYDGYKAESERKIQEFEAAQLAEESSKTEEMSPLQKIQKEYESVISGAMAAHGYATEQELIQKQAEMYNRIRGHYDDLYKKVIPEEIDFKTKAGERSKKKTEQEERFKTEHEKVKQTALSNVEALKKADPQVVENFKKSGIEPFLADICKAVGLPYEYLAACKPIMEFSAKAAKAMVEVEQFPEREKVLKQQWEKDLLKIKNAELPSQSNPLPTDVTSDFVKKVSTFKKSGVSLRD